MTTQQSSSLSSARPRRLRLSRSRALSIDVLHYRQQVPTCAHDREVDLSRLVELRSRLPQRISWALMFIKAFGLVAQTRPLLRQTYFRWPWPHVSLHPHSAAVMALHRDFRDEPWLFWARFPQPETQSLIAMQEKLAEYQQQPVATIFRQQLQLSGLPTLLRRLFWWWTLNVSPAKRAKRTGTFFLSTLAGSGAVIQHPPAFLTSNMTYGPMDENNRCRVTIAYDHRLMDGLYIAECLADLETTLNGPIADELEEMIRSPNNVAGDQDQRAA